MALEHYEPGPPPIDMEGGQYVLREFRRISEILDALLYGQVEEVHQEPDKPFTGMIRLADGSDWDPGSGRGVYWYDENSASWNKLG